MGIPRTAAENPLPAWHVTTISLDIKLLTPTMPRTTSTLQIQIFVSEETFLVAIVERHVAHVGPGMLM